MEDAKVVISKRAARFLNDGDVVNLGIGMPEMVANYLPEGVNIIFQSENGIMGMGAAATAENEDTNRSNAGGKYVTVIPGASFFDSATSFGLIRGGHVDATILGALQVDEEGSLASHIIPGKLVPGMGGAMLAMVACGEYETVKDCCAQLVSVASTIAPEPALVVRYEDRYQKFRKIYPGVKALFPEL